MPALAEYGTNPNGDVNPNADHGWGGYEWPAGVPDELLGSFTYRFKCVDTTTATITMRRELIELATVSLQIADAMGYPVYGSPNPSGEPTWGPWSYENRPIGGTQSPSNHSRGRAWDWNAPRNSQSWTFESDLPVALVAHMESIGWYWGGRYVGSKYDAMHFEYGYRPEDVAGHVAKARAILASLTDPAPQPSPNPTPTTSEEPMSAAEVQALTDQIAKLPAKIRDAIVPELRANRDNINTVVQRTVRREIADQITAQGANRNKILAAIKAGGTPEQIADAVAKAIGDDQ